jgi:quinohemoprotein amine dehydrogenase
MSVKRMLRLHGLQLTPEEAKKVVRYLGDQHGLTREEAARSFFEVERRVHWSEAKEDKELRASCAECHTLGRVFSERRDETEWKLLKATHLAFFPLAGWQAFRGDMNMEGIDWDSMSEQEANDRWEAMRRNPPRDQADRVLERLAKEQPLFCPEWEAWQRNRRNVPLEGTWSVSGHEPGRGDLHGTLTLARGPDETYTEEWELAFGAGPSFVRRGKGLLYGGTSWRGRTQSSAAGEPPELRDALLLSEDWNTLSGRMFTGEYNELGLDLRATRAIPGTEITGIDTPALLIPSHDQRVVLRGRAFPEELSPFDFQFGAGVQVKGVERLSAERVALTLEVEATAERGSRVPSFRTLRAPAELVLYDTIDYLKVTPEMGLARTGGKLRPPQYERFEAVAMNRGVDDEPYTADDFPVRVVPAEWSLEEFPVRENDDDARFVGQLDPRTGVFTPALDGPNPERRWSANNIGEVYVVATCKLQVADIPKKPKKKPKPAAEGAESAPEPVLVEPPKPAPPVPAPIVEREFRARGRLLVMVPIYVQWDRYLWEHR